VLNAGTHAVHGTVRDEQVPAPGAKVTVTSGTGRGLTASVGSDGRYALYGVDGEVTIAATLDGFDPDARTVDIENNNTTLDLT
jgi:hypothetical protein